jgi:hypothetical protein
VNAELSHATFRACGKEELLRGGGLQAPPRKPG